MDFPVALEPIAFVDRRKRFRIHQMKRAARKRTTPTTRHDAPD
jgi:hypothetical protein